MQCKGKERKVHFSSTASDATDALTGCWDWDISVENDWKSSAGVKAFDGEAASILM